jgi:uncharacterized Zn finger protein
MEHPTSETILPVRCPKCGHEGAQLRVHSTTVVTVKCCQCGQSWAADVTTLPESVRAQISADSET